MIHTDVLVAGSGLAGITAAIQAAREGAKVLLASTGPICSGASFYPGTWGLGLVGPEGREDEEDLARTILSVGEGMADPSLARFLASHIGEGIRDLEELGVELKGAENKKEKEFIPCFDHKSRDWHGIVKERAKPAFLKELRRLGVEELPFTTVTDLFSDRGQITGAGAVRMKGEGSGFLTVRCGAVILAGGGLGGLFSRRLNTEDVTGICQDMALRAGASLINLEFMQIMPGFLKPAPKTIYNEKVFGYSDFADPDTGRSVFADWSEREREERLKLRALHGPFTCRLGSGQVDIRLAKEELKSPEGILLTYRKELKESQPEFVRTYFQWLLEEKGLTIDDPVWIGMFAHASNGGIRINREGSSGVPGLFACGECTGGMHGADRLGGLSTANGLVFGKAAGKSAAAWSRMQKKECSEAAEPVWGNTWIEGAKELLQSIRKQNSLAAMVVRREEELSHALDELEKIRKEAEGRRRTVGSYKELEKTFPDAARQYGISRQLESALALSQAMLGAMRMRRESRGSHYRADYPAKDDTFNSPVCVVKEHGTLILQQYHFNPAG